MPSIVFMNGSLDSNDQPIELDLTKATKKDIYDAFKKNNKRVKNSKTKGE